VQDPCKGLPELVREDEWAGRDPLLEGVRSSALVEQTADHKSSEGGRGR